VVINDDVAVENSSYTAGRRGVATTVLAEKICGAAAERGYDLAKIEALCRRVNENGRSIGMALTSCTVPAAGQPTFNLGSNEMEMGIGIHGEPGRERTELLEAREIIARMAGTVLADLPFRSGDAVIAMVNGMGGTPLIELYLAYQELDRMVRGRGIVIARRLVGNYITSLDMAGCSITLLRADTEMLSLWDDPVLTASLRWKA
jgi:dihydroxyacetone kinase-like protein